MKLKDLLSENFWNQVAQMKGWEAPPKEKRWSKSMNDGLGHLTEFEANKGGKDYIKEGPSYEYAKHIKNIDKLYDKYWDAIQDFGKLLEKKGMKKESKLMHQKYYKGVLGFKAWFKGFVRSLL